MPGPQLTRRVSNTSTWIPSSGSLSRLRCHVLTTPSWPHSASSSTLAATGLSRDATASWWRLDLLNARSSFFSTRGWTHVGPTICAVLGSRRSTLSWRSRTLCGRPFSVGHDPTTHGMIHGRTRRTGASSMHIPARRWSMTLHRDPRDVRLSSANRCRQRSGQRLNHRLGLLEEISGNCRRLPRTPTGVWLMEGGTSVAQLLIRGR